MPGDGRWDLTLILLTWRIWRAPNNSRRWDLTLILLTWRIWCAPNNARRWKMGFKILKACISFKKLVYLLPVILRINSDFPPPRTNRLIFLMESKYFCSVGTGFTCWLFEHNAWRFILSCFLHAFLYFLFCYFPPFNFCFIIFSFFPLSLFLCIFFIHARSLNCDC